MSDNPDAGTMTPEVLRLADDVRDAMDWYDAVGPAEALSTVLVDFAAFYRSCSPEAGVSWLDISTATKH
jgi:hypothetical protein